MELLAPAGNLEKLEAAVRFGANAVYCGAGPFSLRAPETSFNLEDLASGLNFAHRHDCRVYLALNIFPYDDDLIKMMDYYEKAAELGIDAVIVSDPGVLSMVRRLNPAEKIHLSTQANTTNSESAHFWRAQGVERIILARELSLTQIKAIRKNVPGIELEIFVHGAMCMAYSGRCLLSSFLNERSANRGLCSQPCRWEYRIREINCSEELILEEDERGSYILNARDLCMIEHLPQLADTGIDSIKIEGRMKSTYYVAVTTRVYRAAIDSFMAKREAYSLDPSWLEELNRVSHRPYSTGFYLPEKEEPSEEKRDASYIGGHDFVGMVEGHNVEKNSITVKARNRIIKGDLLEVIDPGRPDMPAFKVFQIRDSVSGEVLTEAHNSYVITIMTEKSISRKISTGSLLRKKQSHF